MNLMIKKLDEAHDEYTFVMQSASERDRYLRCVPHPMLPTDQLEVFWDPEVWRFTIRCVPKPEAGATPIDGAPVPAVVLEKSPDREPLPPVEILNELKALSGPALETRAGIEGVEVMRGSKKTPRNMLIIAVARAVAAKKAAEKPKS